MWRMWLKVTLSESSNEIRRIGRDKRAPLVVSIIAIQIAIPTVAFVQVPPTRFGWQMYSGIGEVPAISVEIANGDVREVSFADVAASSRPELNWSEHLPDFVCSQIPGVVAVNLMYSTGTQSFECE